MQHVSGEQDARSTTSVIFDTKSVSSPSTGSQPFSSPHHSPFPFKQNKSPSVVEVIEHKPSGDAKTGSYKSPPCSEEKITTLGRRRESALQDSSHPTESGSLVAPYKLSKATSPATGVSGFRSMRAHNISPMLYPPLSTLGRGSEEGATKSLSSQQPSGLATKVGLLLCAGLLHRNTTTASGGATVQGKSAKPPKGSEETKIIMENPAKTTPQKGEPFFHSITPPDPPPLPEAFRAEHRRMLVPSATHTIAQRKLVNAESTSMPYTLARRNRLSREGANTTAQVVVVVDEEEEEDKGEDEVKENRDDEAPFAGSEPSAFSHCSVGSPKSTLKNLRGGRMAMELENFASPMVVLGPNITSKFVPSSVLPSSAVSHPLTLDASSLGVGLRGRSLSAVSLLSDSTESHLELGFYATVPAEPAFGEGLTINTAVEGAGDTAAHDPCYNSPLSVFSEYLSMNPSPQNELLRRFSHQRSRGSDEVFSSSICRPSNVNSSAAGSLMTGKQFSEEEVMETGGGWEQFEHDSRINSVLNSPSSEVLVDDERSERLGRRASRTRLDDKRKKAKLGRRSSVRPRATAFSNVSISQVSGVGFQLPNYTLLNASNNTLPTQMNRGLDELPFSPTRAAQPLNPFRLSARERRRSVVHREDDPLNLVPPTRSQIENLVNNNNNASLFSSREMNIGRMGFGKAISPLPKSRRGGAYNLNESVNLHYQVLTMRVRPGNSFSLVSGLTQGSPKMRNTGGMITSMRSFVSLLEKPHSSSESPLPSFH